MKFRSIIAAALLAFAFLSPVAVTGCKSTPNQIAHKTADAVVSSVDIAMQGWADYVVAERSRIAKLPTAEQLGPKSELLKREGRVAKAYGEYQQAYESAHAAVKLAIASNQPLPNVVGDAAAAVLSVIAANR